MVCFHDRRQTKLLKPWQDLLSKLGISEGQDQLFMQSVNQELFQLMLVDYMEDKEKTRASREQQVTLSTGLLCVKILACTRLWIERVNRGSCFPLNDETFHFFVQVEMVVRVLLPKHVVKAESN